MGQSQIVEVTRECDVCHKKVVLVQGQVTEEQLEASVGWYVQTKEHKVGPNQLIPIAKLSCSKTCALRVLNEDFLELPKQSKEFAIPDGPLDMSQVS